MNPDDMYLLTNEELAYLASLLQKSTLIGFAEDYLKSIQYEPETARNSLIASHFLTMDGSSVTIESKLKGILNTLLSPMRAMIVVRDIPEIGKQKVVFNWTSDSLVMHLQTADGKHGLRLIPAVKLLPALLDWFKLAVMEQPALDPIQVGIDELENFRIAVENGKAKTAKRLLPAGASDASKEALLDSYQNRKISGAVSSFNCYNGEAEAAWSFSLIASESSSWLITLDPADQDQLVLKQANDDFNLFLASYVENFTGQLATEFQSYVLSNETLALSLALINRGDLSKQILFEKYPDISNEKMTEILNRATEVMKGVNLCSVNAGGIITLDARLEKAIFPLAKYDEIVQTDIIRPNLRSAAKIYRQNNGFFTSIIRVDNKIVLEFGASESLTKYLHTVYAGFGMSSKKEFSSGLTIHLNTLIASIEVVDRPGEIKALLTNESLPAQIQKDLGEDIAHQQFRATIQRIAEARKNGTRPTLLLLQGQDRSWIFSFAETENNPIGQLSQVTREEFYYFLSAFLKEN